MSKTNAEKNIHSLIGAAKQALPLSQQFLADLNMSIIKTAKKEYESQKPSRAYHPSSMLCKRNAYFQITGANRDPYTRSAEFTGICESGTDRHERIQRAIMQMKDNGFDCEFVDVETFIRDNNLHWLEVLDKSFGETKVLHIGLNIRFKADGIIKYKGEYYILEIKTESQQKALKRIDTDPKHYNQGIVYALSFNVDKIMYLYENRNFLSKKPYVYEVTHEQKISAIGFIEECDEYVNNCIVPPIDKNNENLKAACQYCDYTAVCKRSG